jgi:hypothetical protein
MVYWGTTVEQASPYSGKTFHLKAGISNSLYQTPEELSEYLAKRFNQEKI